MTLQRFGNPSVWFIVTDVEVRCAQITAGARHTKQSSSEMDWDVYVVWSSFRHLRLNVIKKKRFTYIKLSTYVNKVSLRMIFKTNQIYTMSMTVYRLVYRVSLFILFIQVFFKIQGRHIQFTNCFTMAPCS